MFSAAQKGRLLIVASLLVLTFGVRAVESGQPIVENYVGRQIPTAMVARNLERGSGFLRPQLDTAPFPNLFLVEPPIYAMVAGRVHAGTGLDLGAAGRLVSALATALGAWGLYGLVRRREGDRAALLAIAVFAALPVTLRYGRAFQPDALMLGCLLAGVRSWDEYVANGRPAWLVLGVVFLALGLALKVVAAAVLVPLVAVLLGRNRRWKVALAVGTILPALLWYVHAAIVMHAAGGGSRASADNGAIWLRVLIPSAPPRLESVSVVLRLFVRAFTPLGIALAVAGLCGRGERGRIWWIWGASVLGSLLLLAAKLHHEYYWLMLAPVVAVGVGLWFDRLADGNRCLAIAVGSVFAAVCALQALSTWRTPNEWRSLPIAASVVRAHVPRDAWLAAPEALLFEADRRGCRLEYTAAAARRAAGEWGATLEEGRGGAAALVEFYRARGARYVADVDAGNDPARLALHEAIRRRYNVIVDRPGVLLAALTDSQGAPDGTR